MVYVIWISTTLYILVILYLKANFLDNRSPNSALKNSATFLIDIDYQKIMNDWPSLYVELVFLFQQIGGKIE